MDIIQGTPTDDKFPVGVMVRLVTERAHSGDVFSTGHEFNNISGGSHADVLLQPPSNGDEIHVFRYSFTPDVSAERVRLYEGTTVTDTGTAPEVDEPTQRNDGYTPSATVTVSPSVDATGTLLSKEGVPDGQGGQSPNAAVEVQGVDIGLAPGTNYLLRFTNDTNNSADTVYFSMLRYRLKSDELK